jgi:hypothetical protein
MVGNKDLMAFGGGRIHKTAVGGTRMRTERFSNTSDASLL